MSLLPHHPQRAAGLTNGTAQPGDINWAELKQRFRSIGVTWRVDRVGSTTHAKVVDGTTVVRHVGGIWVILPSRPVLPEEIGMGRADP